MLYGIWHVKQVIYFTYCDKVCLEIGYYGSLCALMAPLLYTVNFSAFLSTYMGCYRDFFRNVLNTVQNILHL